MDQKVENMEAVTPAEKFLSFSRHEGLSCGFDMTEHRNNSNNFSVISLR